MTNKQITFSTKDNPLTIFVDGSDQGKHTTEPKLGFGVYLNYEGKEYEISGTKDEINQLLSDFNGVALSNPTMEMLGLMVALKAFEFSSEHLLIRQDYIGAINYGALWNHSKGSEHRKANPWKTRKPYIKYIVAEIEKSLKMICSNGGSVRILWVPGHITPAKLRKYKCVFQKLSDEEIKFLKEGNDSADKAAKCQESKNTLKELL
jgi:ribonuclease HI